METHKTAAILVEKDWKILLIKRATEPSRGFWAVPGGHLDPGETPYQSAQREAREEVGGIEVEKKPFLVFTHSVPEGEMKFPGKHQHKCHAFRGRVAGEIKAGSDAGEFRWFTREEAKRLKLTNYTKIILSH